jgi:hypothetical protein
LYGAYTSKVFLSQGPSSSSRRICLEGDSELVCPDEEIQENGLSPMEKLLRRPEDIKPGYDAFREWVETQHKNVLTKGAIGRALHYAVNQLPLIDPIENKIRPLALGRKNFLFTT